MIHPLIYIGAVARLSDYPSGLDYIKVEDAGHVILKRPSGNTAISLTKVTGDDTGAVYVTDSAEVIVGQSLEAPTEWEDGTTFRVSVHLTLFYVVAESSTSLFVYGGSCHVKSNPNMIVLKFVFIQLNYASIFRPPYTSKRSNFFILTLNFIKIDRHED